MSKDMRDRERKLREEFEKLCNEYSDVLTASEVVDWLSQIERCDPNDIWSAISVRAKPQRKVA